MATVPDVFDGKFFNESSKMWRQNKVYIKKKGLWAYKTFSDSPITIKELGIRDSIKYPNQNKWHKCGYVNSKGEKCEDEAVFTKTEENDFAIDHEIFTHVRFCVKHQRFETKEKMKRLRNVANLLEEKLSHPSVAERLSTLYNHPLLLGNEHC